MSGGKYQEIQRHDLTTLGIGGGASSQDKVEYSARGKGKASESQ